MRVVFLLLIANICYSTITVDPRCHGDVQYVVLTLTTMHSAVAQDEEMNVEAYWKNSAFYGEFTSLA